MYLCEFIGFLELASAGGVDVSLVGALHDIAEHAVLFEIRRDCSLNNAEESG